MRIAYVCADPGVPVFGTKGASVHVIEVVRALRRRGHRVDLFAVRTGGDPPADLADLTVHMARTGTGRDLAAREAAARAADAELGRLLAAAGPVDLVYERYSLWGRAGTAYARGTGVPAVLEVNAPLPEEQERHRGLADRAGADATLQAVLSDATVVAAVSTPVARWARRRGADPGKVAVVPNGVDTARIRPAPADAKAPFTVGFVGTLKPWHGVDVLVAGFARLAVVVPDARLLLVGDGPEAARVRAQADALGVADRMETTGAVAPAEVTALLHRMHVAVAPYPEDSASYFSPLKLYEYLAAGLPVVASRTGQVADVLTDGVDGVLVPPGDAAALANALRTLHDDAGRRNALGAAARRTAVRRHDWDSVVDQILALVPGLAEVA